MVAPGGAWLPPGWGVCMVAGGVYMVAPGGGMRGCSREGVGACMVAPGGACVAALGGTCVVARGGMCGCPWPPGGMHGCWGVCMVAPGGVHGCSGGVRGIQRDTEIRSMSGRYASHWNAFLFDMRPSEVYWTSQ